MSAEETGKHYPQGKEDHYKYVLGLFDPATKFDFYDDSYKNLTEIANSESIVNKPTCFFVSSHFVRTLDQVSQDLLDIKKTHEEVKKLKKTVVGLNIDLEQSVTKKYKRVNLILDTTPGKRPENDPGQQLSTADSSNISQDLQELKTIFNKALKSNLPYQHTGIHGTERKHNPKYEVSSAASHLSGAFKSQYQDMKGDALKTNILLQFQDILTNFVSTSQVDDFVSKYKKSDEYKILATGQGAFTRAAHSIGLKSLVKTDSVKALEKIITDTKATINNTSKPSTKP